MLIPNEKKSKPALLKKGLRLDKGRT